jgi:hypothetical protein
MTRHQAFRRIFSSPGIQLARFLNLAPTSPLSKTMIILIAFILSGLQHAVALYAISRLGRQSFIFFVLQPFGIALETVVARYSSGWNLGWLGYGWTTVWLLTTSMYYFDDLVNTGMFGINAAPYSIVKLLLGAKLSL